MTEGKERFTPRSNGRSNSASTTESVRPLQGSSADLYHALYLGEQYAIEVGVYVQAVPIQTTEGQACRQAAQLGSAAHLKSSSGRMQSSSPWLSTCSRRLRSETGKPLM